MEQVSSNCPSDPALEVIECSKQGGRPQDPIWALASDREGKNCKATCKGCKKGVVYRKVQELYQHAAGCPQLGDSVRSEVQQLAASKGYGYEEAAQQSGSSRRPQPDSIPAAKRHASRGISSMLQHTDPVFNAARKNRIRRAMLIFFVCAAIPWAVADGVPFRSLLKEINSTYLDSPGMLLYLFFQTLFMAAELFAPEATPVTAASTTPADHEDVYQGEQVDLDQFD